jgi:hypothetical protein
MIASEHVPIAGSRLTMATTVFLLAMFSADVATAQHEHGSPSVATPKAGGWTSYPTLTIDAGRSPQQPIRISTAGAQFSSLSVQSSSQPDAVQLASETGKWSIDRSAAGTGGHLWAVATTSAEMQRIRASSYLFLPMKPQVPTEMLMRFRDGLEIIPLRLPEHGGIREGSTWKYLIRHNDVALAGADVVLETAGKTREIFKTDLSGIAAIRFPRDFSPEKLTGENPMSTKQEFVLAVQHADGDMKHLSTFNHHYLPDRMRERSLFGGIGALAFGMVLAAPLLRRKGKKNA